MTLFFVSREDEWALGEKELAFQKVATYVATFIDKMPKRRLTPVGMKLLPAVTLGEQVSFFLTISS